MFGFLFKTGTYYMLWQKFREQFVYLLVSFIFIVLTFSIYDDVYGILKISDKESLWILVLIKYFILIVILSINIHHFKSIKVEIFPKVELDLEKLDPTEQHMMDKPKLKSKTDFIMEKYKSKKSV